MHSASIPTFMPLLPRACDDLIPIYGSVSKLSNHFDDPYISPFVIGRISSFLGLSSLSQESQKAIFRCEGDSDPVQ